MSDSFKRFQATFEIFANQQAAETEAVRAVLQSFVVNILSNHPQGASLFGDLRSGTLKRLEDEVTFAGSNQDATRKAEFVLLRATQIFDEMAPVFGLQPSGSSKPHN